ncbi:MAG: hypothetical protein MMC33_000116 [Icmadophila ericetorum]|nr:hypothetical protein [Icmadophila ericetorum]
MKHRRPAANDYWIVVAMLGAYGNSVAEIVGQLDSGSFSRWSPLTMVLGYAIGVIGPNTGLSSGKSKQAIQILLTAELSWSIAIGATKTSILLFYLQLFEKTSELKRIRVVVWVLLLVTALFTISTVLYFAIHCRSLNAEICGNQRTGWISISVFNIVTDILILSLPVPFVWNLQLPQAKRLALTGVFGVGFLVCIISILRIFTLVSINPADFTSTSVNADLYSVLEPTLGITSACLPIVGPIYDRLVPARFLKLHHRPHPSRPCSSSNPSKSRKSFPAPTIKSSSKNVTMHDEESDIERLKDPIVFPSEPIIEPPEKYATGEGRPAYPYQDHQINLSASRYTAEIRGHTPIPLEDLDGGSVMEGVVLEGLAGIRVEQEWSVTSTREV